MASIRVLVGQRGRQSQKRTLVQQRVKKATRRASTSGDGNLLFKETHLTRESLLAYMRCVARDPACITFPAYNYPKHKSMVLKVLMSLYVGPDPKKKRKLHDNRKGHARPASSGKPRRKILTKIKFAIRAI